MSVGMKVLSVMKSLIAAYVITGLILVLLAYGVLKLDVPGGIVNLVITGTYVVGTFLGGFVCGKSVKEKQFLWGTILGICYIGIIYLIAIIFGDIRNLTSVTGVTTLVMCIIGGTLGGMLS